MRTALLMFSAAVLEATTELQSKIFVENNICEANGKSGDRRLQHISLTSNSSHGGQRILRRTPQDAMAVNSELVGFSRSKRLARVAICFVGQFIRHVKMQQVAISFINLCHSS